jgi:predicted PurR-regulated permease PerM
MVFVMIAFVKQAFEAVHILQAYAADGHFARLNDIWERLQDRFPQAGSDDLGTTLQQYGGMAAEFVASKMGTILKHSALFLFHLGVTILAMFYFYRDGVPMVERLREVLPFEMARRDRILGNAHNLIFASVTSSLVAAAAQGTLGALAFGITGIRAPIFWGVMMGFFSFIPVIGSTLIWFPAAISLLVGGHMVRGVVLIVFCAVIIGMVDNFIRPWFISGRSEMDGLIVFVSVLGGIEVFGPLGVVLGPVIVATALSLLDLYAPHAPEGN